MKLFPLVKHWLDEDLELVGALILGSVHPPVIAVARITSSGWLMTGRCLERFSPGILRLGLSSDCKLKQSFPMLWPVSSLGSGSSFLGFLFPPSLCGFLVLPSRKQNFLKGPVIPQLQQESLAGQSFQSLCLVAC